MIMKTEQKKIKIEPRIKLHYNIYSEADKSDRGRRKLQSIFLNLKDSTIQFLVRKILTTPFLFDKLSTHIIFILSYKNYFSDIHKLAHFRIPKIQKLFVDNTDFSFSKYKKFCSGQISTPLLQTTDIEIFTKILSQLDSLKITRSYKALLDISFLKINVAKATIFTIVKIFQIRCY